MAPANSSGAAQPDKKRLRSPDVAADDHAAKRQKLDSNETSPKKPIFSKASSSKPDSNSSPPDTSTSSPAKASSWIQKTVDGRPIVYTRDPFLGFPRRRQMMDDLYDRMKSEEPEKWEKLCRRRKMETQQLRKPDEDDDESATISDGSETMSEGSAPD